MPTKRHAAASATLRYGVAQGWLQDETARSSVNIEQAIDRVTHTGLTEMALHMRGRHDGPAQRFIVEPNGMVLVLTAAMVRGVPHGSRVSARNGPYRCTSHHEPSCSPRWQRSP